VKIRVGQGFDVHRFAADGDDRALVLGGVTFAGERGLVDDQPGALPDQPVGRHAITGR